MSAPDGEVLAFERFAFVAELRELGATENQAQELARDPERARAAIGRARAGSRVQAGEVPLIAAVLRLYRSPTFLQARGENLAGRSDPARDDEGDRIWQPHEVDEAWRAGYLGDCVAALEERREPAARYAPSDEEFVAVADVVRARGDESRSAAGALAAWAEVWRLPELAERARAIGASVAISENDDLVFDAP